MPEDTAKYLYNILWSTISDEDKALLEKEYEVKCPSHIPIWKFVLYNYTINTGVKSREPLAPLSSAEIILGGQYEIENAINKFSKNQEKFQEYLNESDKAIEKMSKDIEEMKDVDTLNN